MKSKKQRKNKNLKQGFTLLELLVVVLIIGILASIALPQYNKTVEKTKVAEALLNIKILEESMQRYILTTGCPSQKMIKEVIDLELSGGEWDNEDFFVTKNFWYNGTCYNTTFSFEVERTTTDDLYLYALTVENNRKQCVTQLTDIGRYICKYLESQGWEYQDAEL